VTTLRAISRALSRDVDRLSFGEPVTHVYNPLAYARAPHEAFLERWGGGRKEVVLVGMNPGPFGMAQTGVPFGDVGLVRDFLGIEAPVKKPKRVHPKRPIEGFACERSEVSGSRLWGFVKERFGTPDAFFSRFFVVNYCPLVFMEETGRNRTPDKLAKEERAALEAVCDKHLGRVFDTLDPALVVGVGVWAEKRCQKVVGEGGPRVGVMLHPSPASPKANQGWAAHVEADFERLGVRLPRV
jgi:single-strand selective monofunctional uracil DNA glycosylase